MGSLICLRPRRNVHVIFEFKSQVIFTPCECSANLISSTKDYNQCPFPCSIPGLLAFSIRYPAKPIGEKSTIISSAANAKAHLKHQNLVITFVVPLLILQPLYHRTSVPQDHRTGAPIRTHSSPGRFRGSALRASREQVVRRLLLLFGDIHYVPCSFSNPCFSWRSI